MKTTISAALMLAQAVALVGCAATAPTTGRDSAPAGRSAAPVKATAGAATNTPSHTAESPAALDLGALRSQWLETSPNVFLRYQRIGSGPEVVVLLHELGASLENWDEVVPQLVAPGRTIIRYDQRGAGMSSKIRSPITMHDHAHDLAQLLDGLGVHGRVRLIGDTFGASVALQFAADYPDRTAGVLAMGPTAYLDPQPQRVARFPDPLAPGAGPATMTGKPYAADQLDAAHVDRTGEFHVVYPPDLRTDPQRLARFYGVAYSADPTSVMLTLRMVYATGFRDTFARIRCPVLLTRSTRFMRPASEYQEMAASIPGARWINIDSGHYAAAETPERVGELARSFLAELGS